MNPRWLICCWGWACYLALLLLQPTFSQDKQERNTASDSFRELLQTAEINIDALAEVSDDADFDEEDWQILLQVCSRWQQFRAPDAPAEEYLPRLNSAGDKEIIGEILRIRGQVVGVEVMPLPDKLLNFYPWQAVYRCQLQFSDDEGVSGASVNVLTTSVPRRWLSRNTFEEPVLVCGVLAQFATENRLPLILTDHIAWYPNEGGPTGQLLLARLGMDVTLLDEVRHRQPFVKPEVSREGEAFYSALKALRRVDQQELVSLAAENVANVAATWRDRQPKLRREHQQLLSKLANEADVDQRDRLQREVKAARDRRGIAAAVIEASQSKRSSVAPFFLQPEKEVGELVSFEGIARRAVEIAVEDQPEIKSYYEIEIFTADSQNLPIVCCVNQLPPGFPVGDEIREPVRIAGVFFKNWRYRSRKLRKPAGLTGQQRRPYTPVVLGKLPTWLENSSTKESGWALWGGVAFLGFLVALWIVMTWLGKRDRSARASLRGNATIDL